MTQPPTSGSYIPLSTVRAYLSANGWRVPRELSNHEGTDSQRHAAHPRTHELNRPFEIWTRGDVRHPAGQRVLVPLIEDAPDYVRRIEDLIRDVATFVQTTPLQVGRELALAGDDVVELRAIDAALDAGSIALADANVLLRDAREAVVAAACSTLERKPHHGRSRPHQALDLAHVVRMGHTQQGSFVIPIVSPVGSIERPANPDDELTLDVEVHRQMFPRRAFGTLLDGLQAIHGLAVRGSVPSSEQLSHAVAVSGVSSDLCLAVADMTARTSLQAVVFDIRWALTAPPAHGVLESAPIEFPAEAAEPLRLVGERLRDQVHLTERVVYGYVSTLERDADDEVGTITVKSLVEKRIRPIKMVLPPESYHLAARANDEKLPVVVSGVLERAPGRSLRMASVHYFDLEQYLPGPANAERS